MNLFKILKSDPHILINMSVSLSQSMGLFVFVFQGNGRVPAGSGDRGSLPSHMGKNGGIEGFAQSLAQPSGQVGTAVVCT